MREFLFKVVFNKKKVAQNKSLQINGLVYDLKSRGIEEWERNSVI